MTRVLPFVLLLLAGCAQDAVFIPRCVSTGVSNTPAVLPCLLDGQTLLYMNHIGTVDALSLEPVAHPTR